MLIPIQEELYYCREDSMRFRYTAGFSKEKSHREPQSYNIAADAWAKRLLSEEVKAELKEVYNNCKARLGLKRRQIKQSDGVIETDFFRYQIEVQQSQENPAEIFCRRYLHLRAQIKDLPLELDIVFPQDFDQVILPYESSYSFDELVDKLEDNVESQAANLLEDEDTGEIIIKIPNALEVRLYTKKSEISFMSTKARGPLSLGLEVKQYLKQINILES